MIKKNSDDLFLFKKSWIPENIPDNINKYFSELEITLSSLNSDIKKELEGSLKSSSIEQWISACFELDIYELLKSANLKPNFLSSNLKNEKIPDFSCELLDKNKIIIECTVLHKNFIDSHSINKIKAIKFIEKVLIENAQNFIPNSFEIETIKVKGRFGKSDKNNILEFLEKFQLNSKIFQDFYDSKSLEFSIKKIEQKSSNKINYSFLSLQYKNLEKQIENKLKEKSKQTCSYKHPTVVIIGQWNGPLGVGKRFGRVIDKLCIKSIKSNISAVVILPNDFFPFLEAMPKIDDNNLSLILRPFQFLDTKKGGISSWSKGERYIYFFKNPQAKYPISYCFEEQLLGVIEILSINHT